MKFIGTCEKVCSLDVSDLIAWATAIPLEDWPKVAGNMRTIEWRDAATVIRPFEEKILDFFPNTKASLHYFSMMFPGHKIAAHCDPQINSWICRVHVPIITNSKSVIIFDDGEYHLRAGEAYKLNTLKTHSVQNNGETPRIHWMFDVISQS